MNSGSEWKAQSSCRTVDDPDLFFPPSHLSPEQRRQKLMVARRVCAQCPVFERCREYAIKNNERHGIWAAVNVSGKGGRDRLHRSTRPGPFESRHTERRRRAIMATIERQS